MTNFKKIAHQFHEKGFRVIPVNAEKKPACKGWRNYQHIQTKQDIDELFQNDCHSIAMLTGTPIKQGEKLYFIEAVDIDVKYDLTGSLFSDYVKTIETFEELTLDDLYIQTTRSKGFHFVYLCDEIDSNQKLAKRPATQQELDEYNAEVIEYNTNREADQKEKKLKNKLEDLPKTLLETRGEGGYILINPSQGYEIQTGSPLEFPVITKAQRAALFNAAKSFNEIYKEEQIRAHKKPSAASLSDDPNDVKPLDDYNQRGDVEALLYSHGWSEIDRVGDRINYRRPNKKKGNSGDFNTKLRLFKTWSDNTPLEAEVAYSPASLFIKLEHSGDKKSAAKDLYSQNYGSRLVPSSTQAQGSIDGLGASIGHSVSDEGLTDTRKQELQKAEDDFFQKFLKKKFDINKPPPDIEVVMKVHGKTKTYDVGGLGMLGLVVGREKSGKSTLTSVAVASAIKSGAPLLNLQIDVGGRDIVFLDTEQSNFFYYHTQKRTLKFGGHSQNYELYHAWSMKEYDVNERIFLIDKLVDHFSNLGLLIIDGVLDICEDYNDVKASKVTVDNLLRWRDKSNALVLGILHLGKGQYANMLGHVGALLARKCDFAIEIASDADTGFTSVSSKLERFEPFTSFEFRRDSQGIPILKESALNILGQTDTGLGERIEAPVAQISNEAFVQIAPQNTDQQDMKAARENQGEDEAPCPL